MKLHPQHRGCSEIRINCSSRERMRAAEGCSRALVCIAGAEKERKKCREMTQSLEEN